MELDNRTAAWRTPQSMCVYACTIRNRGELLKRSTVTMLM